jgi:hypothetical protein
MWSLQEQDGCLQRVSALGNAEDGTPKTEELHALAAKWLAEGGVPPGGGVGLDEQTSRRACVILTALAWLRSKEQR